jgi:hypothetical protein
MKIYGEFDGLEFVFVTDSIMDASEAFGLTYTNSMDCLRREFSKKWPGRILTRGESKRIKDSSNRVFLM